jgi:hypothetical protein
MLGMTCPVLCVCVYYVDGKIIMMVLYSFHSFCKLICAM